MIYNDYVRDLYWMILQGYKPIYKFNPYWRHTDPFWLSPMALPTREFFGQYGLDDGK